MKRIGMLVGLLMTVLGLVGCSESETPLHLEIRPVLFDGYRYDVDNVDAPEQMSEAEQTAVFNICNGRNVLEDFSTTSITYDGTYRSFPRFSYSERSYMTELTVFHDESATYAHCQDEIGRYIKLIDPAVFPNELKDGTPLPIRPQSISVPDDVKQAVQDKALQEEFYKIQPSDPAFVGMNMPLLSILSIHTQNGDETTSFSRPYDPRLQKNYLSLHFMKTGEITQPLIMERYSDNNIEGWPLDSVPEGGVPKLERTHNLPNELEFNQTYPVWDLLYTENGKSTRQSIAISIEPAQTMSQKEIDQALSKVETPTAIGYFHKTPLYGKADLHYLDAVQTTTADAKELRDMLTRAELVNRRGEVAEYPLFTLIEGVKSQTFEVSVQKRSKKTDVYVTTEGKHFKLNSEDSSKWLSYAPY